MGMESGLTQTSYIRNEDVELKIIKSLKLYGKYKITDDDKNDDVFQSALNFIRTTKVVTFDDEYVYLTDDGKNNWITFKNN